LQIEVSLVFLKIEFFVWINFDFWKQNQEEEKKRDENPEEERIKELQELKIKLKKKELEIEVMKHYESMELPKQKIRVSFSSLI
jgi:hypothetical protein